MTEKESGDITLTHIKLTLYTWDLRFNPQCQKEKKKITRKYLATYTLNTTLSNNPLIKKQVSRKHMYNFLKVRPLSQCGPYIYTVTKTRYD